CGFVISHLCVVGGGGLTSTLSTGQPLTEQGRGGNTLGDSGAQLLCEGLKHPNCRNR
ncbi:unnamed protein product, partial [Natator depressus]